MRANQTHQSHATKMPSTSVDLIRMHQNPHVPVKETFPVHYLTTNRTGL